jgi:ER-bound oxygenase mpaB/B'/Rubber oxygenase, catalytic domain
MPLPTNPGDDFALAGDVATPVDQMPKRWPRPIELTADVREMAKALGIDPPQPSDPIFTQLAGAMLQDDIVAGDLVAWMAETKNGRALFDHVLEHGLANADAPPAALARFFAAVERRPSWADPSHLRLGCEAHLRLGEAGRLASAIFGLLAGYRNAATAAVLVKTSSLTEATGRRLAETTKFVVDAIDSEGMPRFSNGYKSTVRVRLVHAFVRRGLAKSAEWRSDLWGPPITLSDTLGTALQFWVPIVLAMPKFGYSLSTAELDSMRALWNYVALLQGVPESLLPKTLEQAYRLNCAFLTILPPPGEDSKRLGMSFMATVRKGDDRHNRSWLRGKMVQGAAALLLPKSYLAELGVEDTVFKIWPALFRPLVRRQERQRLRDPALHTRLVSEGQRLAHAAILPSVRAHAKFDPKVVIHDQSGLSV